jgi:hypothetical protein
MTITRTDCFCDNPECRASTSVAEHRFSDWETISVDGVGAAFVDAHLCERCSGLRAGGQSLDFRPRMPGADQGE